MNLPVMQATIKKYGWSILAMLGAAFYAYQVIYYAATTLPNMDEGAFLLKGLTYANGKFVYYQDYGYWNTKMFFSYYLWGYIQLLFGPGLLAPRIFTILFNLSTALAIWLIARDRSPHWLAPLALWVMALNTPFIKILSRANSQVVVNVLIVWIVFIFIRKTIREPYLILGSMLVGVMVLTRENMVFFVAPWIIFVWWDKGTKPFLLALFSFLAVMALGHALFYPQIFGLWLRFLPSSWVSDPVINLLSTPYNLDLEVPFFSKLVSLSYGIRHYYVQVFGFVVALFYIFKDRKNGSKQHEYKANVFLAAAFLSLLVPHVYASIGLEYCTFCFSTYLAFFINIAFVLILLTFDDWQGGLSKIGNVAVALGFALIYFILWLVGLDKLNVKFSSMPFPRLSNGILLGDLTNVGTVLANKFKLPMDTIEEILSFVVAMLVMLIVAVIVKIFYEKNLSGYKITIPMILFGMILVYHLLGVTDIFGATNCVGNVSGWYSQTGEQITKLLPKDSKIYIDGTTSALPLMYLSEATFYPAQVDNYYSFVDRSDSDFLLKHGFWNEQLQTDWLNNSNVYLVEPEAMKNLEGRVKLDEYQRYDFFYDPGQCGPQVEYLLLIKKDG